MYFNKSETQEADVFFSFPEKIVTTHAMRSLPFSPWRRLQIHFLYQSYLHTVTVMFNYFWTGRITCAICSYCVCSFSQKFKEMALEESYFAVDGHTFYETRIMEFHRWRTEALKLACLEHTLERNLCFYGSVIYEEPWTS